jgi:hypothetical protein
MVFAFAIDWIALIRGPPEPKEPGSGKSPGTDGGSKGDLAHWDLSPGRNWPDEGPDHQHSTRQAGPEVWRIVIEKFTRIYQAFTENLEDVATQWYAICGRLHALWFLYYDFCITYYYLLHVFQASHSSKFLRRNSQANSLIVTLMTLLRTQVEVQKCADYQQRLREQQ